MGGFWPRPGAHPQEGWIDRNDEDFPRPIARRWLGRRQHHAGGLGLSRCSHRSTCPLYLGRQLDSRDLLAGPCLDVRCLPGLGHSRSNSGRFSCYRVVRLGLQQPAKAPGGRRLGRAPAPRKPGERNRFAAITAGKAYFLAAACSAFDMVSFSGCMIVLLTARRAAPRLGYSDSMPSRCRT